MSLSHIIQASETQCFSCPSVSSFPTLRLNCSNQKPGIFLNSCSSFSSKSTTHEACWFYLIDVSQSIHFSWLPLPWSIPHQNNLSSSVLGIFLLHKISNANPIMSSPCIPPPSHNSPCLWLFIVFSIKAHILRLFLKAFYDQALPTYPSPYHTLVLCFLNSIHMRFSQDLRLLTSAHAVPIARSPPPVTCLMPVFPWQIIYSVRAGAHLCFSLLYFQYLPKHWLQGRCWVFVERKNERINHVRI